MRFPDKDRIGREPLRIVFNDRVVFLPLGSHATLGDVAQAVRDVGSRRFGGPLAVDVTMPALSARLPAADTMPAHFRYEDDPAAVCDFIVSPGATFSVPGRVSEFAD